MGLPSLLVVVSLAAAGWIGVKAVRAFRLENADFHPRRDTVARPAADQDLAGLRDVSFAAPGGPQLRGWWLGPRNGAAIILCHGSGADRTQLLPEARILARQGYGILLFDWPGHGESGGRVAFAEPERQGLSAAIDFVAAQPGVTAARIGALGFSMGGALVVQVAARDPRLRALVIEGSYANANELTRYQYGSLMQWPARLAGRLAGMRGVEPIDAIRHVTSTPKLIVCGGQDRTVPSWMCERLFEAAPAPKQFWLVPGAAHGGYDGAAPDEYARRLREFFAAVFDRAGNSPT